MANDIAALSERLDKELTQDIHAASRRARQAHWLATILMTLAIVGSFVAGLLGLTGSLEASQVGALALLPGTIAIFGGTFKPDKRAGWHYRKVDALRELRNRLLYGLPIPTTAEKIDAIVKLRDEVTSSMQREWEDLFIFDWAAILKPNPSGEKQPNPRPDEEVDPPSRPLSRRNVSNSVQTPV